MLTKNCGLWHWLLPGINPLFKNVRIWLRAIVNEVNVMLTVLPLGATIVHSHINNFVFSCLASSIAPWYPLIVTLQSNRIFFKIQIKYESQVYLFFHFYKPVVYFNENPLPFEKLLFLNLMYIWFEDECTNVEWESEQ